MALESLSDEHKQAVDAWIERNGLDEYGDSADACYMGGTPLLDERSAKYTDRYDYIQRSHPSRPWLHQEDSERAIDAWIVETGRNRFGDAEDAVYAGGSPLFDERTGTSTDRYAYIRGQHPTRPWDHRSDLQRAVDVWLEANGLNFCGDPKDAAYPNGSPLVHETTGALLDRYDVIAAKFPDRPWESQQ